MNYALAFGFICMNLFPLIGVAQQKGGSRQSHGVSDQCVPIISNLDVQALKSLSSDALQISSGQKKITSDQMKAASHLAEEGRTCGLPKQLSESEISKDLQVMEILLLEKKVEFTQEELSQIRSMADTGMTLEELSRLASLDPYNLSEKDQELLTKYIDLIKLSTGLIAFSMEERLSLLKIVAENLENGFTNEQLMTLRTAELLVNGLSEEEIDLLFQLVNKKEMDTLLKVEGIEALKKWILIENLPSFRNLIDFYGLAKLHELIQSQSNPPFSPKELKLDSLAFESELKSAPFIDPRQLKILEAMAENTNRYIGQNRRLSPIQLKACKDFVRQMVEFGRVPELNPVEVAQLLQLIELRVEFQNLMYEVKKVRFIELSKSQFTLMQKNLLNGLKEKIKIEQKIILSKEEVSALKSYILKAKNPGGLNGFDIQYRVALIALVENSLQNQRDGFTPSDLEILRRVEQQNNGFTDKDMYQIKMIAKNKQQNKTLTLEESELLKEFIQIENKVGMGTLMDKKETPLLYETIQTDRSEPQQEEKALIYESNQKPLAPNVIRPHNNGIGPGKINPSDPINR